MPITTEQARMVARLGVMRVGASRLSYYQPWAKVLINGVDLSDTARVENCTVQQNLDGTPWTARVSIEGTPPSAGADLRIYLGDTATSHRLFSGIVLAVTSTRDPNSNSVVHHLDGVDYSWGLNRSKVMARWTSQSISAIVASVIGTWTLGFTVNVESGLDTISEFTATNEDVSDILDRLAVFAAARWWVDAAHFVHFTTQPGEATTPITDVMPGWGLELGSPPQFRSTIAQRTTRFWVRGGGTPALIQVPIGATSIPIADATWFPAAQDFQGGPGTQWTSMLESGTQRFNYGSAVQGSGEDVIVAYCAGGSSAGAAGLSVDELAGFADSGWAACNGVIFRYTFKTSPTGAGYLDGIPTSSYGSIAVDTNTGDPVVQLSSLESVSSVTEVIPQGQDISILYEVQDIPAQSDLQSDLGAPSIL